MGDLKRPREDENVDEEEWNIAQEMHPEISTVRPAAPQPAPSVLKIQDQKEHNKNAKSFFASLKGQDLFAQSYAPPMTAKPVKEKNKLRLRVSRFTPPGTVKKTPAKIEGEIIEWSGGEFVGHVPQKQETDLYNLLQMQLPVRPPIPVLALRGAIEISGYGAKGIIRPGSDVILEDLTYGFYWGEKELKKKVKKDGVESEEIIPPTYEPRIQFQTKQAFFASDVAKFQTKLELCNGNAAIENMSELVAHHQNKGGLPDDWPDDHMYFHPKSGRKAHLPHHFTNEWVLSRRHQAGFVVLRIDNSIFTHEKYFDLIAETQYQNFDGWVATTGIPNMEGLSRKETNADNVESWNPCLNGSYENKDDNNKVKFEELVAIANPAYLSAKDADGEPFKNGQVFFTGQKNVVTALDIQNLKIWTACGQQLMTGCKAVGLFQLDAEKSSKCYDRDVETSGVFSFSYAAYASFLYDYKNMFDACALRMSPEFLVEKIKEAQTAKIRGDPLLQQTKEYKSETEICTCMNFMTHVAMIQYVNENAARRLFYIVPSSSMVAAANYDYQNKDNVQCLVDAFDFYGHNMPEVDFKKNEAHFSKLFGPWSLEKTVVFAINPTA